MKRNHGRSFADRYPNCISNVYKMLGEVSRLETKILGSLDRPLRSNSFTLPLCTQGQHSRGAYNEEIETKDFEFRFSVFSYRLKEYLCKLTKPDPYVIILYLNTIFTLKVKEIQAKKSVITVSEFTSC